MGNFNIKSLFLIMALFCLCSCASKPKYHLDVALTHESYSETYPFALSQILTSAEGSNVTTLEGNDLGAETSGPGFRIGITEEVNEIIVTRISYGYSSLKDINYKFNIQGTGDYTQALALTNKGLDISIGINIWRLRPSVVYKKVTSTVESTQSGVRSGITTTDSSITYLGLGLSTEFNVGKESKLYIEYQSLSDNEVSLNNSGSKIDDISLGFRYPLN